MELVESVNAGEDSNCCPMGDLVEEFIPAKGETKVDAAICAFQEDQVESADVSPDSD